MKKRLLCAFLLIVMLAAVVPMAAMAGSGDSQARLNYVTDRYGLLTSSETAALESLASSLSERYGCSLYILIVRDYSQYASSTFRYATSEYTENNLGWGSEKEGIMLMLSMSGRDYELLNHGSQTDYALTEYARDVLEDAFLPYFRQDQYFGGFREFLSKCGEVLQAAEDGKPMEKQKKFSILSLLPGVIAAAITGGAVAAPMKSVGKKTNANAYLAEGAVNLQERSDMFLHRTVTRVPRQTSSGGSGSSHGTTHSSGGFSGRSGKF